MGFTWLNQRAGVRTYAAYAHWTIRQNATMFELLARQAGLVELLAHPNTAEQ